MKRWTWLALGLAVLATSAHGADYRMLRNLSAPPPVQLQPLASGTKVRAVQFVKIVIQPRNGEAWALSYNSTAMIEDPDHPRLPGAVMNWSAGRVQAQPAAFARAFDEELTKGGFAGSGGESLFSDGDNGADLKIAVLIDDMKGRFCLDCPNLLNPKGVPASVVMTANWEVYSALDRRVVLKVTTSGGADYKVRLNHSTLPPIYKAFRENVRLLMANEDFRKLVTTPLGPNANPSPPPSSFAPISFAPAATTASLRQAPGAVAVVFAADGSGSGFLISSDGYLLTNHHVVAGMKYVKLKWSDGSETLGEVVRTDPRRDVALVKTDARGRATLSARHTAAQQGEPVYAIGAPLGEALQGTMTKGIVSANRVDQGQAFIQSDVAVTHGNSGGPLLDEKGQVLGITDWGRLDDSGLSVSLNFFIPIDDALRALALTPAPAESPQVAAAPPKTPAARKR